MFKLIEYMIQVSIARNQGDALEQIGLQPANIRKIRAGANKFTVDQIDAACKKTGASADYVFGYTDVMMRKSARKPIDMLKQAVKAVEDAYLK